MKRNNVRFAIVDLMLLLGAFILVAWVKPGTLRYYLPDHAPLIAEVAVGWVIVSWIAGKYAIFSYRKAGRIFLPFVKANLIMVAITGLIMYMKQDIHYSRLIIFGMFFTISVIEGVIALVYFCIATAKPIADEMEHKDNGSKLTGREKLLYENRGHAVLSFVKKHADINSPSVLALETAEPFNIDAQPGKFDVILNTSPLNYAQFLQSFLASSALKLQNSGIYIGCFETQEQRATRLSAIWTPLLFPIVYILDLLANRMTSSIGDIPGSTGVGRRGKILSRERTLSALEEEGFELIGESEIDGLIYFAVRKTVIH